jgi:phage I-like protein
MAEAIGRATAAAEAMVSVEKLSKRVAKLEGEKRAQKVDKLFAGAQREGRVVRAEVPHLKAAFKGRPVAELEAYLAAKPRVVSNEFAQESAASYPSAPVVGAFATPGAAKAMSAFNVTPEQLAARAAERGMTTGFPGAAQGNGGSK